MRPPWRMGERSGKKNIRGMHIRFHQMSAVRKSRRLRERNERNTVRGRRLQMRRRERHRTMVHRIHVSVLVVERLERLGILRTFHIQFRCLSGNSGNKELHVKRRSARPSRLRRLGKLC